MRLSRQLVLCLSTAALSFGLGACGAAPAQATTAVPVAPEPTVGAIQPHGSVTWRDEVQNNDALQVSAEDLPSLANDSVYAAWLQGKDQDLFLGVLGTEATGAQSHAQSLTFVAPDHANLLDGF